MAASLRNKRVILRPNEEASFPLHGDSIRVTAANVPIYFKTRDGNLDFYLQAGEKATFEGNDFIDLIMYHLDASDQAVIVSVGKDSDIGSATVSGNVTISGGLIDLSASTLAALEDIKATVNAIEYGASYRSSVALAANTPEQIFSAAANVNGAVILSAQYTSYSLSVGNCAFLAKSTAPVGTLDGDAILSASNRVWASSAYYEGGSLISAVKIPAGKGLYFISSVLEGVASRSVLYKFL